MLSDNLLALVETAVESATPGELPRLIGALEAARAAAWARLLAPQEPAKEDRLVAMPEVAARLGIKEHQAREMGRRGGLPVVHVGERHVRVSSRALEEWIKRGTLSRPRGGR
jgi:excisionase family DNA binding protein